MTPELKAYISQLLNSQPNHVSFTSVGGGSINQTFRVTAASKNYFCKINSVAEYPGLFAKESNGLQALASVNCIATPAVQGVYEHSEHQILLLEWIEGGIRTTAFWKDFGERLAKLHTITNTSCGFHEDNYMGALPQLNTFTNNWCDFFRDQRLKPQAALAGNKLPASLHAALEKLYSKLQAIFPPEPASLLHGDLWSGNFLCNEQSEPVLIDPAVYFGHSSMDLAMTNLFGGFDKAFYDAYSYWRPLPANYREQWEVCNLYPLLIHLNLFGGGYLSSIAQCLRRFA
jgi:protein-ribulosamine 3-kinase